MNYGSDPADQVVRYSLEGAEAALKLSGLAAKNFAVFAYAVLKDQKKTRGKTRLVRMLKEQRPLKFFTVPAEQMKDFAREAKRRGLLFVPIRSKQRPDEIEIAVFADDVAKVSRALECLKLELVPAGEAEPEQPKRRPPPPREQYFPMVMELLEAAQVPENGEDGGQPESPLDVLFSRLEMKNPDHIAVRQYKIFKMRAGKTLRSILIGTAVRLAAFNLPQIAVLASVDELHLEELGERKIVLFCCIPDADKSLNYLVGMLYMQLIQTLYFEADRKHKGRLPVPVHLLIDEAPNISLPAESFLSSLATIRSRNIFCSYIAQNMAQIKAIFKEQWESLVGLCDEFVYLGGNEQSTHKYVSELLGKETLDINTYGQSRGRSGSYSTNFQQAGRELLTPDEVRMLDNGQAILFVRGERPMLDGKFDLKKHPLIGLTEDGGAEPFDYTVVPNAAEDLSLYDEQIDDLELLSMEDFLDDDN